MLIGLIADHGEEKNVMLDATYGRDISGHAFKQFFANVARLCTAAGVKKLLSAGSETSGAVHKGLRPEHLQIGPEIAPGVPALRAKASLVLALEPANFVTEDYFDRAARVLSAS